jgi:hypothetical protein
VRCDRRHFGGTRSTATVKYKSLQIKIKDDYGLVFFKMSAAAPQNQPKWALWLKKRLKI